MRRLNWKSHSITPPAGKSTTQSQHALSKYHINCTYIYGSCYYTNATSVQHQSLLNHHPHWISQVSPRINENWTTVHLKTSCTKRRKSNTTKTRKTSRQQIHIATQHECTQNFNRNPIHNYPSRREGAQGSQHKGTRRGDLKNCILTL